MYISCINNQKISMFVLRDEDGMFRKSLFSPFFGQKQAFWVKPTYIQLPIRKEGDELETNFFPT